MRNSVLSCLVSACCVSGSVFAWTPPIIEPWTPPSASDERPQPVSTLPVEIGQWHSNLSAAKLAAQQSGVPLLVIYSLNDCTICGNFDEALVSAGALEYFANRGLIMVYQKAGGRTDISNWAGPNGETKVPLVRITWWAGNVDYNWTRPSGSATDTAGRFTNFRNTLESKIGAYVPNTDTTKDKYDDANDTAAGAPTLTWSDQGKTEELKLAKSSVTNYTDLADWFTMAVESGKTYTVAFSDVSGVIRDTPQVALYSDAGTTVVGAQTGLASGDFRYVPTADGSLFVKVWRTTSLDTNILYTMTYQRFAPGEIEFNPASVSVAENAARVTLTVKRVGGTTGTATVQIGYEDSGSDKSTKTPAYTATAGQDFNGTPSPATLTWTDGDAADKTVTFTLIKDVAEWEGAETFGVILTPVTDNPVGPAAVVTLLEVDPMVTRAASYNGWVSTDGVKDKRIRLGRVTGTMTLTVSAAGRITGKAVFPGKAPVYAGTYTVKDAVYQSIDVDTDVATITGNLVRLRESIPFELRMDMESGQIFGAFGADENERMIELFRDDWAQPERQALAASLQGYYTVAFPVADTVWPTNGAPTGSGYATLTVDGRGRFRASGKLGDGTSFSQSGVLAIRQGRERGIASSVCAMLFTAPSAYQGGSLSGLLDFGNENGNAVWELSPNEEIPIFWTSLNPVHVGTYDAVQPGFTELLWAVGGWYNKGQDLRAFYTGRQLFVGDLEEPLGLNYTLSTRMTNGVGRVVTVRTAETAPSVSWQAAENLAVTPKADGSGFTVPAGDLVKTGTAADGEPIYNYATGVNPNGLRLSFNRASGLMSGSFNGYYDYPSAIDTTVDPAKLTWRHAASRLSYAGVLLQEQASTGTVVTAYGYYLSSGKAPYPGSARTYSFKQSSEFRIHAVSEIE